MYVNWRPVFELYFTTKYDNFVRFHVLLSILFPFYGSWWFMCWLFVSCHDQVEFYLLQVRVFGVLQVLFYIIYYLYLFLFFNKSNRCLRIMPFLFQNWNVVYLNKINYVYNEAYSILILIHFIAWCAPVDRNLSNMTDLKIWIINLE